MKVNFQILFTFIFINIFLPQSFSDIIKEIDVVGNDYFSDFEVIYFSELEGLGEE